MATEQEKIEALIGPPWSTDPFVYSWQVNGPEGITNITLQWHENGAVIGLPSGEIAIKDARSL